MSFFAFLSCLGPDITDCDEESFLLFSQPRASKNLGFLDPKAAILEITVGSQDLAIHQSPAVLSSDRQRGTTGAGTLPRPGCFPKALNDFKIVVWSLTPLLASYLARPNNLFHINILSSESTILELGCGISGIIALALAPLIRSYTLTDQDYVMKLLKRNVSENLHVSGAPKKWRKRPRKQPQAQPDEEQIQTQVLDWERETVTSELSREGFDAILASDCIYNPSLIKPFVQTCVDTCLLRSTPEAFALLSQSPSQDQVQPQSTRNPTVCIIAQQLRSPEVFEEWLREFTSHFRVWRLPHEELGSELGDGSGYVVHVGILKDALAGSKLNTLP